MDLETPPLPLMLPKPEQGDVSPSDKSKTRRERSLCRMEPPGRGSCDLRQEASDVLAVLVGRSLIFSTAFEERSASLPWLVPPGRLIRLRGAEQAREAR